MNKQEEYWNNDKCYYQKKGYIVDYKVQVFEHYINFAKLNCVLELGCGNGQVLKALAEKYPKCKFVGIDYSDEAINRAKELEQHNLQFMKGNILDKEIFTKNKFIQTHYDGIISWSTLHYIYAKDVQTLFTHIKAVLQKERFVVFLGSIPMFENIGRHLYKKYQMAGGLINYLKLFHIISPYYNKKDKSKYHKRSVLYKKLLKTFPNELNGLEFVRYSVQSDHLLFYK